MKFEVPISCRISSQRKCTDHSRIRRARSYGLLDSIFKHQDKIRHIQPRIEQSGGFIADVYFRLTGQPLAVYASTGPGPMNMMIATANAFYDNSAFFLITGQVPTTQVNSGALQDDYRFNGDLSLIHI